ncbi:electron transfer flavoprotein subunit beta/FixA family protein [Fodinisporobacter ferrooxydans]|uniref:Electron transfer flavoprotein subunit beta n=1 Tax=Fodinisporobacter ferrooxydans TaxID=2901836 RepID=A0ABY4CNN1_9BACL|nr:electron transfer flavoprotein subunit beta/FixA family protein [Alicyclobacillaceae bacterium MYW30-H2]
MNIYVILKQTFDTEEKIVIENEVIREDGMEFIINPYDEYAIEEAIRLRDEFGGEVTVLTVGPGRAENALRTALAMGADKGIIVDDETVFGDEFAISKVLASVIKNRPYDMILAGNMSIDNGSGQIGPRLAEELGIPHVTSVTKVVVEGKTVTVTRDAEGDQEVIEISMPLLITAQQGLNEPRYPSLPGIMKAKKKPIERLNQESLGLQQDEIKSKTVIIHQYLPLKKQSGRVLTGELTDQVSALVNMLRNEVKVI